MKKFDLLDITSDFIFKNVFVCEKNKDLLISILNSILKGEPEVKDVILRNTELSKQQKNNPPSYLDIRA